MSKSLDVNLLPEVTYAYNLKERLKDKYFRKGYEAAGHKESRVDNPYKIPDDVWELLRKRARWDRGWEEKMYTPTKAQLRHEGEMEKQRHSSNRSKHKHHHEEHSEKRSHKH